MSEKIKRQEIVGNSNLRGYVDLHTRDAGTQVGTNLREHGLCTFDRPLNSDQLVDLAQKLGAIVHHPDADNRGIMRIWPDEGKVDGVIGGAFARARLPLHTDGKGVAECFATIGDGTVRRGPADFLLLQTTLVENPESGVPNFCDGHVLYRELQKSDTDLFSFLNSPDAIKRYTTQPNYLYTGPLFEKTKGGITVRFNFDESKDWPPEYLERFLSTAERLSFEMPLNTGQGYIIDNRRMLHGRSEVLANSRREANHVLIYTNPSASIGKYLPVYSL